MNREQRERREQGIITDTPFFGGKGELSLRGKFSGLLATGDTSFYAVVFGSPPAFRTTRDTPFEFHEPRTTRTTRTRASSSFTALGSHPGGEVNLSLVSPFFVRVFRAFRG